LNELQELINIEKEENLQYEAMIAELEAKISQEEDLLWEKHE